MMKVQLVFSPSTLGSKYEALGEKMWPPMGILYIAAYLREKMPDIELSVVDGGRLGYDETLKKILEFKPDILGLSVFTLMANGAARLSREVKKLMPDVKVVVGGPHPTALTEEVLKDTGADLALIGEGEASFYELVKALKEKKGTSNIPGLAWLQGSELRSNPAPCFIDPVDQIPFPAWDLIDFRDYHGWIFSKQNPESTMLFSRGCPFECVFCSNEVWKTSKPALRLRSPKNIVDEMQYLKEKFGILEIFDQSDEFNNSLEHALKVCKEIKDRGLGITWKAQLRARPVTEDLAKAMAEAGCWYVHLGIESGNQETLDGIGKKITKADVENACRILKKYGIKVCALFMIYNVWEENGELKFEDSAMCGNTYKFARDLIKKKLVDYTGCSIATPYPGSKLYKIAVKYGLINERYVGQWDIWQKESLFVMDLPGISKREQNMVKLKGELFRVGDVIRNMDFKIKDIPFLIKRGLHVFFGLFGNRG